MDICKIEGPWYNDKPPSREFRSDIQILRCLAVTLVLLFHLDIIFFSGGFIGVDIFFVISGYLVVGSIFRNCLDNKFDCFLFLANRIKRLFPASAICLLFIIILFLIFPQIQQNAGNQGWYDIIWAASHAANVKFYINENQYFRADNTVSFTLHYWSLALEEQFYLVFPILFLCFYKICNYIDYFNKLTITIFITILGIISFILCLCLPNQKFFLLHTRVWEFLAGSIIALFQKEISSFLTNYKSILNIFRYVLISFLIFCSIFVSSASYPNEITLIIVVITCMIIAYDEPIENTMLESIGNWSYSIYLYHFPIIQLFKNFDITFQIKMLVILALISIFAVLSFYIIEQQSLRLNLAPFTWYSILIIFSCIIAIIAACLYTVPALTLITSNNISYYNKSHILDINNISLNEIILLKHNINVVGHTEYLSNNINTYFSKNLEFTFKEINKDTNRCLLLYGDSNAMQWYPAILHLANTINISTIFFAYSYDRYKTGKMYDERENEEYITHSMNNIKFQQCNFTISIFVRTSMHLLSYNNIQIDAFFQRLTRLSNFFAKKGCSIIVEGIPREPGEYNPNYCLLKEINNVDFIKKCALNKNTYIFNYNPINVSVLYMNKYLCVDNYCPANYKEIPIYMDQSHISEGIVFMLSKTFTDEIINMPCLN
jgi:peptidoglycan/LPS O-acetylase OafA/YrhL